MLKKHAKSFQGVHYRLFAGAMVEIISLRAQRGDIEIYPCID